MTTAWRVSSSRIARLASATSFRAIARRRSCSATRCFSISPACQLRTTELQPSHYDSLKVNSSRLWKDIHSTADRFGTGRRYGDAPEQTGLSRLSLTDHDKAARDWFVSTTRDLGCEITVDQIGNIFAVRRGLNNDVPATFVGSHLDSQPLGGRFDGVLGVCAGIEMLRVLNDNWIETEGPVGVINWTNEEGARFPVSMMGSGAWAATNKLWRGHMRMQAAIPNEDGSRPAVSEELRRIGYHGDVLVPTKDGGMKMASHFELHIEQGPRLLALKKPLAVVTGSQAYAWFEIIVLGRSCHTGTTPLASRADPMGFAAKVIYQLRQLAQKSDGLASVGIIHAEPGSVNTVPDKVTFTLDVRHESDAKFKTLWSRIKDLLFITKRQMNEEANKRGDAKNVLDYQINKTFSSPATQFDETAIACIEESCKHITGTDDVPRMISGAGHDSVNTAKHCPTAMVFVPCKDGVSHHPEEWCEQEDCARGADVILQSVLRFDRKRSEKGEFGSKSDQVPNS